MQNYQEIAIQIDWLRNLKVLVETYETIAASSMRGIRNSVLQNRAFHTGLNRVFQDVIRAYRNEVAGFIKKNKIGQERALSLLEKNGKTALVFLSANTGLYGDLRSEEHTSELQSQR